MGSARPEQRAGEVRGGYTYLYIGVFLVRFFLHGALLEDLWGKNSKVFGQYEFPAKSTYTCSSMNVHVS